MVVDSPADETLPQAAPDYCADLARWPRLGFPAGPGPARPAPCRHAHLSADNLSYSAILELLGAPDA